MESLSPGILETLIATRETRIVELKGVGFLTGFLASGDYDDEILRQMSAFGNRSGGRILVGVEDDGTIGNLDLTPLEIERFTEKVANLARDKTSPPVEFVNYICVHPQGNVIVVEVPPRVGPPHAVVRRAGHEIISRRYFIRTTFGTRHVDDTTLAWLFRQDRLPKIRDSFDVAVAYAFDPLGLAILDPAPVFPQGELIAAFQGLDADQCKQLQNEAFETVGQWLVELLPFCFLSQLSWLFSTSWRISTRSGAGLLEFQPITADSTIVSLREQLPIVPNSYLDTLKYDPWEHLRPFDAIALPRDTILNIEIIPGRGSQKISRLSFVCENQFTITLDSRFRFGSVNPPNGHPIFAVAEHDSSGEVRNLLSKIRHVVVGVDAHVSLDFPDIPNERYVHIHEWAMTLVKLLKETWDWGTHLEKLPPSILYGIEYGVRRIQRNLGT